MNNGDMPINPTGEPVNGCAPTYGLTKREYFAGLAMQGFMANANQECVDVGADGIAKAAVSVADALLAELEK